MKLFPKILLSLLLLGVFVFTLPVKAQIGTSATTDVTPSEKIEFTLFHLDSCPHCKDEINFIYEELLPEYGNYINLNMYEVSSAKNQELYKQYAFYYKSEAGGSVPVTYIDGEVVFGFLDKEITGEKIINIIKSKLVERGLVEGQPSDNQENATSSTLKVPFLGNVDPQTLSLPLLTIILGLLDGFNPCAMWVLLFLITLLLGMKNRKRMWMLGSIFIFTSALVYFVFMAAWLQFIMFIGLIALVRWVIGLVAIYVGGSTLRKYWKNRKADGVVCEVTGKEKNRKVFDKIKNIVHKESLVFAILGIILLGFSVNLVELACSAGFPAIFTQVLAMSEIPVWQRFAYMIGYIFFYMLDDMIVFVIAMITLQVTGFGGKYAKYVNAFGGLLIFVLGLLLILKPEWLMFG